MNEPKWTPRTWYVGAMNDALFVIDQPPSPSGSDAPVDTPHPGLNVIAKVAESGDFEVDRRRANMLAAAPDLFEALEAATNCLAGELAIRHISLGCDPAEFQQWLAREYPTVIKARAALTKARGGAR